MAFCDYCDCDMCVEGLYDILHAKTSTGRWICEVCYEFDVCVCGNAKVGIHDGPCETLDGALIPGCPHRPRIVGAWTTRDEDGPSTLRTCPICGNHGEHEMACHVERIERYASGLDFYQAQAVFRAVLSAMWRGRAGRICTRPQGYAAVTCMPWRECLEGWFCRRCERLIHVDQADEDEDDFEEYTDEHFRPRWCANGCNWHPCDVDAVACDDAKCTTHSVFAWAGHGVDDEQEQENGNL
jgi:hypothetical protein